MSPKNNLKDVSMCLVIDSENNLIVETFKLSVKRNEKKASFNKHQAINRIIKEWANDRDIQLTIKKKDKKELVIFIDNSKVKCPM